jgi:hypothetical protein
MRRCYRLLLIGVILGGSLLCQQPGAGIVEPALRQFMPPSRQAPNFAWPDHRFSPLPVMPYPYPRAYVYPSVGLNPYAPSDAYATGRPPTAEQGYLRLEVKPPEAEIFVDGNFIGRGKDFSGPAAIQVAPGGHLVEFRSRQSAHHIRLFVAAGEIVDVKRDLGPTKPAEPMPSSKRWSTPSRRQAY